MLGNVGASQARDATDAALAAGDAFCWMPPSPAERLRGQQAERNLAAALAELERVRDFVRISTVAELAAADGSGSAQDWASDLKAAAVDASLPLWKARFEGGRDILEGEFAGVNRRADADATRETPPLWLALRRADAEALLAKLESRARLPGPAAGAAVERGAAVAGAGGIPSGESFGVPTVTAAAKVATPQTASQTHNTNDTSLRGPMAGPIRMAQAKVKERGGDDLALAEVWPVLYGLAEVHRDKNGNQIAPWPPAPIIGQGQPGEGEVIRYRLGTGRPLYTKTQLGKTLGNLRAKARKSADR